MQIQNTAQESFQTWNPAQVGISLILWLRFWPKCERVFDVFIQDLEEIHLKVHCVSLSIIRAFQWKAFKL